MERIVQLNSIDTVIAVFGQFDKNINMISKQLEAIKPDYCAVAFDVKHPTFRHEMFSEYKAGRKGMPPELAEQMPVLKELLTLMGIKIIEKEGYEADDIIGTLASACEKSGHFCYIATGDRDSFQLVSDSVNVLLTATVMGRPEIVVYDNDKIAEKYNAVALINAGEFADTGGQGNGAQPMGLTYSFGKKVWGGNGSRTFMGFTKDNKFKFVVSI